MPSTPSQPRRLPLRLIHDGAPPGTPPEEPLHFGLQDSKGEVHPGVEQPDGSLHFDLTLDIKPGGTAAPIFIGPFAHGPPAGRFLYLSWKREGQSAAPWAWRIKIPLSGIGWPEIRAAGKSDARLEANVIGRRPHASDAIKWRPS
jgi:Family of unknown function (DUF5990)